MNRLIFPLVTAAILFVSTGCSAQRQLTMPMARCYHVGQNVNASGEEDVFLAVVSQGPAGGATTARFPKDPINHYMVHSGSVDSRKSVDVGDVHQAAPVLWRGELTSGQSVHLFVRLAKNTPGTENPGPKLFSTFSDTVNQDAEWSAADKATLRNVGMAAQAEPAFASAGTTTLGAFVITVTKPGALADPTVDIHPIDSARDSKSGYIGGATIECSGDRSHYEIGVALSK